MKLSNFGNYHGMSADPKSMRVATVTVTVPMFWFLFSRTIHRVPIVRPYGSRFWQFLNPDQSFICFEQMYFGAFGQPVKNTPDTQAEQLELEYVRQHFGRNQQLEKFMACIVTPPTEK